MNGARRQVDVIGASFDTGRDSVRHTAIGGPNRVMIKPAPVRHASNDAGSEASASIRGVSQAGTISSRNRRKLGCAANRPSAQDDPG